MRVALALAAAIALGGCNPSGPARHTELQWIQCESDGLDAARVSACSAVAADRDADPQRRAAALVHRGVIRAQVGQHVRAVADFGRALRLDPSYAQALVERGAVHQERGAFAIAVRDFDAALALDPTLTPASARREAALQGRTAQFQAQLDQLNQAIGRDPFNASLFNNRCWLRVINDDNLELALNDCNESIRIDPRSAAALDSRGLVHLKRGDDAAAEADYTAALAIEPESAHYLYGRGVARLRMGLSDAGHGDMAEAERLTPGIGLTYRDYGIHI